MGAQAVRLSNVDIDHALKNKDFEVLFQPIFDLGNGALARVETFVRWRHPKLGLLPPGAFISFFESQGRMGELTRYVLAHAIQSYTDWRGPWAPGFSVNLALSDLSDDAFTSHFTKLLRDHDFPADLVTLECPMPPVDMSIETAAEHFQRLASTGARLAIEVRGRANDLLRALDPFPFDEIKTGGSAILRFARTVRGPGLSAIADLLDIASKANAAITAVGVEDQASLSALRGLGFTAAQGNHLAKVGALNEFRPHRINEVRELLGIEPLTAENIAALFRTEAPVLQTAAPSVSEEPAPESEDALIERLNERVAQFDVGEPAKQSETTQAESVSTEIEDQKKNLAREKAKALALAKRAKASAARKAAAIERAKAKSMQNAPDEHDDSAEDSDGAQQGQLPHSQAPRDMQERLTRAFNPDENPAPASSSEAVARSEDDEKATKTAASGSTNVSAGEPVRKAAQSTSTETVQNDRQQTEQVPMKRAVGQNTTMEQPSARHGAPILAVPVSLAVGTSGAYFQPGIRVGAPALLGEPENPVKAPGLKLPKPPTQETPNRAAKATPTEPEAPVTAAPAQAPQATPRESLVERAVASLTPEQSPIKTAPVQEAPTEEAPQAAEAAVVQNAPVETPQVDGLIGDLHADDTPDEAVEKPARRKNFLTRKYQIQVWPTHFWPKSWKRSWRRRAAMRAAQRAENQPDVQPQAAE